MSLQYKILLDEKFGYSSNQTAYLKGIIRIFKEYFRAKIVIFEPFYSSQNCNMSKMDSLITRQILTTRKYEKYNYNNVIPTSSSELTALGFSPIFIGKINYILEQSNDNVIIVPYIQDLKHRDLKCKHVNNKVFFIGNFDQEIDSNIKKWIQQGDLIKIQNPSFSKKFPAEDFCAGYDDWRSEILQPNSSDDKISTFYKIGLEVAERNKYLYDSQLTALNKTKAKKKNGQSPKRQIFKSPELDVYLSTDFENGGFEVYNCKPTHQGQYKFNGDFEKEADDNSHPLYLK